jgi:Domain of unknown function (DUF1127)
VEGFQAYRQYSQAYRELTALDDRQLRDIGITRSMIRSVAITGVHHVGETGVWQSNPVSNRARPRAA